MLVTICPAIKRNLIPNKEPGEWIAKDEGVYNINVYRAMIWRSTPPAQAEAVYIKLYLLQRFSVSEMRRD
jgi:hypothetical protein